jgi:hypothetical protein
MRRREFIALMGASVTRPFAAMAQQAGRTYRLGVLAPGPRSDEGMHAFFDGVRRSGFIEGQNLTVIYHDFTLKIDLLSEWAAELVKARVDDSAVLLPGCYSPRRTHPLCCEWPYGEHVDRHLCAERRQIVWADSFRLVGAARQLGAVRPPDAAFLIELLTAR